MTAFYIILSVLLFGVLILVHEFGHFITTKLFGVQVNEFSLFMGPAIWKRKRGETLYAVRTIPIGGYCAMEGEDGDSDNPRSFSHARVWKRLIILVAGSFMNLVIGVLICGIFTSIVYADYLPAKRVSGLNEFYTAADGFQVGDEFYSINGERVYVRSDIPMLLRRTPADSYQVVVLRDGSKVPFQAEYRDYDGDGTPEFGLLMEGEETTLGGVISYTLHQCMDFSRLVRLGLVDLITGNVGVKDMSGPVGIVSTVVQEGKNAQSVGEGVLYVLYLFSFIAINLAVMNLLPIPALDGGRVVTLLLTTLLQKIFRRKINPKYEGYINGGFMILLLLLMAFITFKDIFQLFGG